MNKSGLYHTVAVAVRIEHIPDKDRVFLVFEIIDEHFKQKIKAEALSKIL